MYLMYYDDEEGNRVYTLQVGPYTERPSSTRMNAPKLVVSTMQKAAPDGTATQSAHPARFSPDDKFSRERLTCKKRFGLLPTQQKPLEL